jgi:hypothetical protein
MILVRCAIGLCRWTMLDSDSGGALTLAEAHARGMHDGHLCTTFSNEVAE